MDKGEVRDYIRFLIDDKAGSIVVDGDLNILIDRGIDKVCSEIRKLRCDYFIKTGTLAITANTRDYNFALIGSDVDKVRMVEKNISPTYPKLIRIDWLKHKIENPTASEPKYFYVLNNKIYFLPVPEAVYSYTIYYEQSITYPIGDTSVIPLIPTRYHDIVGIYAALLAKQHISHYQKQAVNMDYIVSLMADRIKDLAMDLSGNRNEDVEITRGIVGMEAGQ